MWYRPNLRWTWTAKVRRIWWISSKRSKIKGVSPNSKWSLVVILSSLTSSIRKIRKDPTTSKARYNFRHKWKYAGASNRDIPNWTKTASYFYKEKTSSRIKLSPQRSPIKICPQIMLVKIYPQDCSSCRRYRNSRSQTSHSARNNQLSWIRKTQHKILRWYLQDSSRASIVIGRGADTIKIRCLKPRLQSRYLLTTRAKGSLSLISLVRTWSKSRRLRTTWKL